MALEVLCDTTVCNCQ